MFAGNFWWTTSKYVSKLPQIDLKDDYKKAESWLLSSNEVRILNLFTSFGRANYLSNFSRYRYDGSNSKQVGITCGKFGRFQ